MPLYSHKTQTILFVHIPKTGGSSLEEMLVEAGAKQALKFHKRLAFSASTPQHMHWRILRRWVPFKFYDFCFTIVRNPWTRLASEYAWRKRMNKGHIPEFNKWVRETIAAYKTDPYIFDNHIRPQSHFVGPPVNVFKLEDGMDAVAKAAFHKLALPYTSKRAHHSRRSAHEKLEITPSTRALVSAFYSVDFANFGYDPSNLPAHLYNIVPEGALSKADRPNTLTQMKLQIATAIRKVRR